MIPEKRRSKILKLLSLKDVLSVDEFVEAFGVARITVQRDIAALAEKGLVEKVHGGVKLKRDDRRLFETLFSRRLQREQEKKAEIAQRAADYVQNHSTIFVDSSSTCYIFAQEVFRRQFTDIVIVTNSPAVLFESLKSSHVRLITTGGELQQNFNMFSGHWVVEFLQNVNLDQAFISAAGISKSLKLTTSNAYLAEILQAVLRQSKSVNVLADSTKFFQSAMLNVAELVHCDRLISDAGLKGKLEPYREILTKVEIIC